jgi:hypothetical protein
MTPDQFGNTAACGTTGLILCLLSDLQARLRV